VKGNMTGYGEWQIVSEMQTIAKAEGNSK
jgi:hypothetical protein